MRRVPTKGHLNRKRRYKATTFPRRHEPRWESIYSRMQMRPTSFSWTTTQTSSSTQSWLSRNLRRRSTRARNNSRDKVVRYSYNQMAGRNSSVPSSNNLHRHGNLNIPCHPHTIHSRMARLKQQWKLRNGCYKNRKVRWKLCWSGVTRQQQDWRAVQCNGWCKDGPERLYGKQNGCWNQRYTQGTIADKCSDRSYIVEIEGRLLRRNRRYLRNDHTTEQRKTTPPEKQRCCHTINELPDLPWAWRRAVGDSSTGVRVKTNVTA